MEIIKENRNPNRIHAAIRILAQNSVMFSMIWGQVSIQFIPTGRKLGADWRSRRSEFREVTQRQRGFSEQPRAQRVPGGLGVMLPRTGIFRSLWTSIAPRKGGNRNLGWGSPGSTITEATGSSLGRRGGRQQAQRLPGERVLFLPGCCGLRSRRSSPAPGGRQAGSFHPISCTEVREGETFSQPRKTSDHLPATRGNWTWSGKTNCNDSLRFFLKLSFSAIAANSPHPT